MKQRTEPPFKGARRVIEGAVNTITTDLWIGQMYRNQGTPTTLVLVKTIAGDTSRREEHFIHLGVAQVSKLLEALKFEYMLLDESRTLESDLKEDH